MRVERTYTREQLRFRGPAPAIDAEAARAAVAEPAKASNVRIRGIANTGTPMPDWSGSIALNLGGMRLRQQLAERPLPLLLEHGAPIGFVTSLQVDPQAGLVFEGEVIPTVDAARDALALASGGYPWQCSLFAEPSVVRELGQGERFAVNGRELVGPGVVFEEWTLGEITITAQGRDPMTSAGLAASREGDAVRLSVEVVNEMAEQQGQQPAASGGDAGGQPALSVDELRAKYPAVVAEIEKVAFEAGLQKGMEVQKDVDAEIAQAAQETLAGGETDASKQSPEAQVAAVAASAIREGKSIKSVFGSMLKLGRDIALRGAGPSDPRAARARAVEDANRNEPAATAPAQGDQYERQFSALSKEEQDRFLGNAQWFAAYQRARARGSVRSNWTPPPKAAAAVGGAN